MAKHERSGAAPSSGKSQVETPFDQRAFPADPPRRRPWFLLLSALAVALWLLFLAWMAWRGLR